MKQVGAQAAKFCKKPDPQSWAFLLFGDDDGVISDAAKSLRIALSDRQAETETLSLDQDDIRREPSSLMHWKLGHFWAISS